MSIDGTPLRFPDRSRADPARARIGARVCALIGDDFVTRGLTGRIMNRLPTVASVRVLWDNDTASVVRLAALQLLDPEQIGECDDNSNITGFFDSFRDEMLPSMRAT